MTPGPPDVLAVADDTPELLRRHASAFDYTVHMRCIDTMHKAADQIERLRVVAAQVAERERAIAEAVRLREALEAIVQECCTFPIKDGLAFRCESIARGALAPILAAEESREPSPTERGSR
jgi:hypothetical protein